MLHQRSVADIDFFVNEIFQNGFAYRHFYIACAKVKLDKNMKNINDDDVYYN